jgi:hypothetical protein
MRAILVWPDKRRNTNYNVEPMDYFWVECTLEEAEAKIIPRLSEELLSSYRDVSRVPNIPKPELSYMIGKRFFLISRDCREIEPFPWFFPFAGQWNEDCPFICMRKQEVHDLCDLQDLKVERIKYPEWEKSK